MGIPDVLAEFIHKRVMKAMNEKESNAGDMIHMTSIPSPENRILIEISFSGPDLYIFSQNLHLNIRHLKILELL